MKTNNRKHEQLARAKLRAYIETAILPHLNLTIEQRAQLADIAINMIRMNECNGANNRRGEVQRELFN